MRGNRIRLTEGQLNRVVKEAVRKVIREQEEPGFYDFIDVLDKHGWAYDNYRDVTSRDGRSGTRFDLSPYYRNVNGVKPSSIEELKSDIKSVFGDRAVFLKGYHEYAPEQKISSVVIFD